MSDWRQSDSGKGKPKPKANPKMPKPFKPHSAPTADKPAAKSRGGWRAKGSTAAHAPPGAAGPAKSWTGGGSDAQPPVGSSMKKWLGVSILFVAFVVLTVFFIRTVFFQPRKLPLFVFSVGQQSAAELLENPFGNFQRDKLRSINTSNILARAATQNGNDNALAALNSPEWVERFEDIQATTLTSGGPSGRVVAFYIGAYAAFTPNQELMLYPQAASPFTAAASGPAGLKLEDALASLASTLNRRSIGWVALDLRLPPLVTNLGDLDPPWRTATEKAISRLKEDARQKLIVTLAADDGQQNWIAPEYSSSFFGHYYRQFLEGRFAGTSSFDPNLTFGKFRQLLDKRVANEVSNRRYALQKPVWIFPELKEADLQSLDLVTIDRKQAEDKPQPALVGGLFDEIDALWQKVAADYRQAYRWDPLGYARVESQLLALEEVALNQPDSFSSAQRLVTKALDELHRPEVGLGVSLIEDEQRTRYLLGNAATEVTSRNLATQWLQGLIAGGAGAQDNLPSFWKPPPAEPPAAGAAPAPPETQLAPAARPYLVWYLYAGCAESDNAAVWDAVFRQDRLQAALDFAGAEHADWLEIYLLRRLASDIDWQASSRNRSQACAKLVRVWQRLQKLATHPDPEVSWRLRERESLPPVEQQFLRGFDQLLAGQTTEAVGQLDRAAAQLAPLEQTAQQLAAAMGSVQEALYATPHLLGWLLREYQFANEQEQPEVAAQLQRLGRIAQQCSEMYAFLAKRPAGRLDEGLVATSQQVSRELAALQQEFGSYVDSKTDWREMGGASANPQTYRRNRIALLSGLLPLDARQRLHVKSLEFLRMELAQNRDQSQDRAVTQRSSRQAAEEFFLKRIEAQRERWAVLVHGDARTSLESRWEGISLPSSGDAVALRSELLPIEFWQRVFAASYGQAPSLHDRLANASQAANLDGEPWPWSSAWQRWNLAAANGRVLQVERLASAAWGDGPISESSIPEDFYFYRLAKRAPLPKGFKILEPAAQLATQLESEMQSATQTAVQRVKSQRAQFGEENQSIAQSGSQRASVRVLGEPWDAVAQVFMGSRQNRLPWLRSQPTDRLWIADLSNAEGRATKKTFDASYWNGSNPPQGSLLVRGHVRSESLNWRVVERTQQNVELVLEREPPDGAMVRVQPPDQLPDITVMMLIDCSDSMNTMVDDLNEAGNVAGEKTELFKLVKQNASAVLRELREIHGRDADVRIGLILFGLEQPAEAVKNDLRMLEYGVYRTRNIDPLSVNWFAKLDDTISSLRPSRDTPLYNSIVYACNIAKDELTAEKTFVYVFSDGVNLLNSKPYRSTKTASDVRQAVDALNARLSIFHFDYFETWIEQRRRETARTQAQELARNVPADKRTPDFPEGKAREIYKTGTGELNGLTSLGAEKYSYYRSGEANKLLEESLATIPRSSVTIVSVTGTVADRFDSQPRPLGEKIDIPQKFLPATLEVSVTGPFEPASIDVEALGGERLMLPYDASGRFRMTPFMTSGKLRCKQPTGGNLQSRLFVRTLRERLETTHELGLELHFWNENPATFTRRPRFLVAEVAPGDAPRAETFVLADYRYTAETQYPEARLSEVPWPSSRQPVRLRVWAADTLPSQLKQVRVDPEQTDQLKLGSATISHVHKGDRLLCTVTYDGVPRAEDRAVIICPDFVKGLRRFDLESHQETHEFRLPDNLVNKSAQLQFTTIGLLQEAAQNGDVSQCDFDEIDLQN